MTDRIRRLKEHDLAWAHALNQQHATELSSLTEDGFADLVRTAFYAHVVDDDAGFLIGLDQAADYASPNFLWFKERLDRFAYVDRIVVSPDHRRSGVARMLYDDMFRVAAEHGHSCVTCEVNADPPNPASDAFHAALGFVVMDKVVQPERGRTVTYLRCDL